MRDGIAGRRNIIIDQTSRNPAAMAQMTRGLRQASYSIELHIMAVPPAISELRIHQRYEGQKADNGFGRFSTKDKHDEAYAGVAETVVSVEANQQVDRLCLYNQNVEPIYDNCLEHGQWRQTPQAQQVLNAERTRSMTPDEARQFAQDYAVLVQLLDAPKRQATEAEKAAMRARYEEALARISNLPQERQD
ncbi:MAG: zeta toxin family protein [Alphaproteobacteria bacterium]|nr:zeta toxin family protein [Alphaproteobacteria bacterium]